MTSLGEVQRIIGLSLNKIQMGRNQRGGLPLHKNLLVATVLNKARDLYMQETMYMNYRLMACGQFTPEPEEMEVDEDTPEVEDYEEDSESDVEDEVESTKKEYITQSISSCATTTISTQDTVVNVHNTSQSSCQVQQQHQQLPTCTTSSSSQDLDEASITSRSSYSSSSSTSQAAASYNSDEGFIDESDCDCDRRNFCTESESRVPFQYCYSCAPFHPSNGRGPTLVGPQSTSSGCVLPQTTSHDQEDKLIYDMDSKSTRNQTGSLLKRKRHISVEETEDAISSILPKKMKEDKSDDLNDSGFQEENEYFHPAFRGHNPNGMEVEQITSLVSIFSFGQQLLNSGCIERPQSYSTAEAKLPKKPKDTEDDSDSDSDTSSDSGHSSDDQNNSDDKVEETSDIITMDKSDLSCASELSEKGLDSDCPAVPTAV